MQTTKDCDVNFTQRKQHFINKSSGKNCDAKKAKAPGQI